MVVTKKLVIVGVGSLLVVGVAGLIVWLLTASPFVDSATQRAAEAILSRVEVPPSFEFRNRTSLGSAGQDSNSYYVGPSGKIDAWVGNLPDDFSLVDDSGRRDDDFRYLAEWRVTQDGFHCRFGLAQVVDPILWETHASLRSDELAEARRGDLAVIELRSVCE